MTTQPIDRSDQVVLPTQPGPGAVRAPTAPPPPPDHVVRHGARCYWDHRECRWVCPVTCTD